MDLISLLKMSLPFSFPPFANRYFLVRDPVVLSKGMLVAPDRKRELSHIRVIEVIARSLL